MKRLPLIATLFMTGIILNCLRQLLAWSVILTREVLVAGSVICFLMVAVALIVELVAYRRARRDRRSSHEIQ